MAEVDALVGSFLWKILTFSFAVFISYIIFKPSGRRWLWSLSNRLEAFNLYIIIDGICRRLANFDALKMTVLSKMEDRPLKIAEVGIGSGPNFEFYPAGSEVYGIEPNPHFRYYMERNHRQCSKKIDVKFLEETGENMVSIGDNTMDAVVLFYILCSVKDVGQVLREAKRVLKKDGTVYVFQHSDAEPKTWRYLLQKLINPIHKVLLSCDLLRKYTTDFEQAGFSDVDLKHVDAACFRIAIPYLVPHLIGTCRK